MPGYLVFGTGQPTKSGFKGCMEVILRSEDEDLNRPSKIMWTNMRQNLWIKVDNVDQRGTKLVD